MKTLLANPFPAIRQEFPILSQKVNGKDLVYLDSSATSQKPREVIEATSRYYEKANANVHRGVHQLSQEATRQFDGAREKVRDFLGAASAEECIFTKGCTEAINLVAQSFARPKLKPGDVILLSQHEHHSNIVPWQMIAAATGAIIKVIPMDDKCVLDQGAYQQILSNSPVKIVGIVHVSNALGIVNPVKTMIEMAHAAGATVLIDGAQAGPHHPVNVADIDADFYTLSCHKIYAPTGVGVLYGKKSLLEKMPPYQGGGDMIRTVSFEKTTYADLPNKFEPGTPNIAGVIGLGTAIDFLNRIGRQTTSDWEAALARYTEEELTQIGGVKVIGHSPEKAGIVSFTMEGIHPHDIGTILDSEGIAIRTGHHCCMPLMTRLGVPATARASFAAFNTLEDADALIKAVRRVKEVLA